MWSGHSYPLNACANETDAKDLQEKTIHPSASLTMHPAS
jgi:hypothetical protein